MQISEMTLEQLQDHALKLTEQVDTLTSNLSTKDEQITELQTLNTNLQKRNHELFTKVEQQGARASEDLDDEKPAISCEQLAQNISKEIIRK